jgi:predicted enzyme related to lactoylglutathione lyase
MDSMANPVVHLELNTTDVSKAKAFYGALFDWKSEDVPGGLSTFSMLSASRGTAGGKLRQPAAGASSAWLPYVRVDDIAAATEKAKLLGATLVQDVTEVPGMGWLCVIKDPTGAALGIWKPKT